MVPNDWQIKRFEEVAYVGNGQVDPREEPYLSMFHIGPENISSNSGQLSGIKKCSDLNLVSGKYEFDKNAIVYSKIRPNLNKICRPDFSGVCNADMYPIWAKADLNIDYLFYYMLGESFYKTAVSMSMRTGMPKINRTDLDAININIPPLPEQQKIAKILTTWDKAINTTERLIENSKQQKKALMQQLLSGKKRLLDSSGQRFSGDWKEVQLGQTVSINRGYAFKSELYSKNGYKIVRVTNISSSGYIDLSDCVYIPNSLASDYKDYELNQGDVLIVMVGATAGKLGFVDESILPALLNQNMWRLHTLDSAILNQSFFRQMAHTLVDKYVLTQQGSARGFFTQSTFKNVKFKIPVLEEQQKIAAVLTNADREIEVLEQHLADLQQEKKALMQQLLTGKKRVMVD